MNPVHRITGVTSEKNKDSVITECNGSFLEYAGANSKNSIIGTTDYNLPWAEYADLYRAHELDALNGNNYSAIIPSKDHKGTYYLFLHTKIQRVDKNNTVIGVFCHAAEIINPDVYKLVEALHKKTSIKDNIFSFGKKIEKATLPKRQEEVLFYLSRGKSAKSIAKILNISFRTVEYYIDILKNKFNCSNKNDLIGFAINNGFAGNISSSENLIDLLNKLKTI